MVAYKEGLTDTSSAMKRFFKKLLRVGLSFASHLIFTVMALAVFRLAGIAYDVFFQDRGHLLFDKVPVSYMLDAGDFVTFALLLWKLSMSFGPR